METNNNLLKFISRHEPTPGQVKVAQCLGYDGLEPINILYGDDPVGDLAMVGIAPTTAYNIGCPCHRYQGSDSPEGYNFNCSGGADEWEEIPTKVAGVFPLATALSLLRAGFELVVFTNSKDARDASKFVCTGADILTLKESRNISLAEADIAALGDAAIESRLYAGARAVQQ